MEFIYDYQKMFAVEVTKHNKLKDDLCKGIEELSKEKEIAVGCGDKEFADGMEYCLDKFTDLLEVDDGT